MRSDARRNRERLLTVARAEFAAHGTSASLNKIAQRAGVGPGTLYRHFPTVHDLLVAIVTEDVAALCAGGRALLEHPDPAAALRGWLRAVAEHATAMRGLVATEMLRTTGDTALAEAHDLIRATGLALLRRAEAATAPGPAAGRTADLTGDRTTSQTGDPTTGRTAGRTEDAAGDRTAVPPPKGANGELNGPAEADATSRAEASSAEQRIDDLLTAVNALAWATEQLPADPHRLDRLLSLLALPPTRAKTAKRTDQRR